MGFLVCVREGGLARYVLNIECGSSFVSDMKWGLGLCQVVWVLVCVSQGVEFWVCVRQRVGI